MWWGARERSLEPSEHLGTVFQMPRCAGQEENREVRKKFYLNQETNQKQEMHFSSWKKMFGENNRDTFWVPMVLLPFLVRAKGFYPSFQRLFLTGKAKLLQRT